MQEIQYTLSVKGGRHSCPGFLSLVWEEPRVHGNLTAMGKTEPVDGVVQPDGRCRLHTRRVALNRVKNYVAEGQLTREGLTLSLRGGKKPVTIEGSACAEPAEAEP